MVQKTTYLLFTIILVAFSAELQPVHAQQADRPVHSYDFRGEPLDRVLDRLARDTETDLVYDPELVRGAEVFRRFSGRDIRELLGEVLPSHRLDYLTLSSGTIVIVKMALEEPGYGIFTGKIVDQRTGEPLAGANAMLADASGGTSAGSSGNFSIPRLISGEHTIIFSFIGYEPVSKKIQIKPDEQVRETIELSPKEMKISPIIVEAHRPQTAGGSSEELRLDETSAFRASGQSPIRDLSLIPGVQYGLPMSDLTLQGGQQSELRILLDGAPVYNPHSIGQMFSSFSPHAISSVTLHRAGYGAAEGSRIAGIVDLKHELPSGGDRSATVQADPLSINLRGDYSASFDEDRSFALMGALRTSYWGTYSDPVLERSLSEWDTIDPLITNSVADLGVDAALYVPSDHRADLSFYDLHMAGRYNPNPYSSLTFTAYVSENDLSTNVLNRSLPEREIPPFIFSSEEYSWQNRMFRAGWTSMPSPRMELESSMSYTYSMFTHTNELGTGIPSGVFRTFSSAIAAESDGFTFGRVELPSRIEGNRIEHFIAKSDLSYSFSSRFKLLGGLQFDRIYSTVDIDESAYLPTFVDLSSSLLSSHLSASYRFGNRWHLKGGSRLTYSTNTEKLYAEPRLSVQYDRPESAIGYWSARLSGGLYRQFINEYRITNTGAAAVVPSFSVWSQAGTGRTPKAYHLNAQWYQEPSERSSIRLETFYKWQPATNITSYQNLVSGTAMSRTDHSAFAESTEMTALGAGVRLKHAFFDSRLELMSGYDYSYTRVDMSSQFGRTITAPWSDPHRAQMRVMWQLLPDLTFAGRWQGIWGRSWAFRDSYYNFLHVTGTQSDLESEPRFDTPENDRLRPFSQIDLSLIYKPSLGNADLQIRFDLINVLNRRNPIDKSLFPSSFQDGRVEYESRERTMPGFYPTASVQVTF